MPSFLLGLLLILFFSLELGIFPTSGYGEGFTGHLRSLTLPAITVGLYLAPILLRTLRVGIIETLGTEYVEAASARGLSERRIIFKHVMRNSLVSTVTVLGLNIGFLISGLVIIENVFALPGLGSELVTAIVGRDYPTVQALTLVFGVAVVAINLFTDLLYAWLDPRVRLSERRGRRRARGAAARPSRQGRRRPPPASGGERATMGDGDPLDRDRDRRRRSSSSRLRRRSWASPTRTSRTSPHALEAPSDAAPLRHRHARPRHPHPGRLRRQDRPHLRCRHHAGAIRARRPRRRHRRLPRGLGRHPRQPPRRHGRRVPLHRPDPGDRDHRRARV